MSAEDWNFTSDQSAENNYLVPEKEIIGLSEAVSFVQSFTDRFTDIKEAIEKQMLDSSYEKITTFRNKAQLIMAIIKRETKNIALDTHWPMDVLLDDSQSKADVNSAFVGLLKLVGFTKVEVREWINQTFTNVARIEESSRENLQMKANQADLLEVVEKIYGD